MSLDGNGTYSPPAPQFPAIPNTVIYADDFNQIILDIATALSTAIFRDGQAAFTANQSMGGFKLVNLANGVNPQDAVTVLQVFTDPTFTGTTTDGVTVTGTKLTVTTTTVALPAGTSIGSVTAAELAYLAGLTSNVQAQLNGKANIAGGNTFTGTQNLTADLVDGSTAVTQPSGDSTTKVATTAFVMAAAFNTALPAQTGNAGKFVSTDGVNAFWAAIVPPQVIRSTRTSNTILAAGDNQKLIDITSGTFTQTFTAAATLGRGWYCYIRNSGTGNITLDPNGTETIDGLTSYIMYPGECRLVQCDGVGFNSIVLSSFYRTFTSSGTFTKPPGYACFGGMIWGGGGGGYSDLTYGMGGGGGACHPFTVQSSIFSASESVTIGAGGSPGATGGTSSVGSLVSSYGGAGGGYTATAGGGGIAGPGSNSGGSSGGLPSLQGRIDSVVIGGSAYSGYIPDPFGGAASGCAANNNLRGSMAVFGGGAGQDVNDMPSKNSVYGGAGGGSLNGATRVAGTSRFGGNGGNANNASGGTGSAGSIPGGGGGAGQTGGPGARGELRIWGII